MSMQSESDTRPCWQVSRAPLSPSLLSGSSVATILRISALGAKGNYVFASAPLSASRDIAWEQVRAVAVRIIWLNFMFVLVCISFSVY